MKILIMGLPGSGKTYLAKKIQESLKCAWYNADELRTMAHDWDFTSVGRIRQAYRMKTIAEFEEKNNRLVICDFVAPTEEVRNIFSPDIMIWLNTIEAGRFEDTNKIFEQPNKSQYIISHFLDDLEIELLIQDIVNEYIGN